MTLSHERPTQEMALLLLVVLDLLMRVQDFFALMSLSWKRPTYFFSLTEKLHPLSLPENHQAAQVPPYYYPEGAVHECLEEIATMKWRSEDQIRFYYHLQIPK